MIGGLKQNGRYKVSARYNKASLRRKLEFLGEHADSIEVRNEDGRAVVERFVGFPEAFIYADPPYVEKGGSLYMNALDDERHRELGDLLNNHADSHWMLTYDDTALIRELYGERTVACSFAIQRLRPAHRERADDLFRYTGQGRSPHALTRRRGHGESVRGKEYRPMGGPAGGVHSAG
ncbi:DNA adenine methylase [Bifidobacterium longum]|uniref:DNA adenine methylase n=1 Tax=Bifidobacterium longum TaxID=216816 RepID=UPI002284F35C|nr:DNA adenine methylase [Bifidobacterium longum]